jgi:ribonuclease HI
MEKRGITHVIIETDSKNVVDAIHNLRIGNSECNTVIVTLETFYLKSKLYGQVY